jgi:hypothetical protein
MSILLTVKSQPQLQELSLPRLLSWVILHQQQALSCSDGKLFN